jgi:hypothetical protein
MDDVVYGFVPERCLAYRVVAFDGLVYSETNSVLQHLFMKAVKLIRISREVVDDSVPR